MNQLRTLFLGASLVGALAACESHDRANEPSYKATPIGTTAPAPTTEAAPAAPITETSPIGTTSADTGPIAQPASPGTPTSPAPYVAPVPTPIPSATPAEAPMESNSLGVPNASPSTTTGARAETDRLNRLRRQLANDRTLAGASGYDISTVDGRVILNGTVKTEAQRRAILRRATGAVGAANVQDNLVVSGTGATTPNPTTTTPTPAPNPAAPSAVNP